MTKPQRLKKKKQNKKTATTAKCAVRFRYQDDLEGCEELIAEKYSDPDRPLFRWTKNPPNEKDLLPQRYMREDDGEEELEMEVTADDRIERNTTSMYISEEKAKKKYKSILKSKRKKDELEGNDASYGHVANFVKSVGEYITKFNLKKGDAVVGKPNKDGHVNTILTNQFDFDRCIDKYFGTKKILEEDE